VAPYSGPIIDVDVHHCPKSPAEVLPFLPPRWRDYATASGRAVFPLRPPGPATGAAQDNGARRRDTFPEAGGPPGSDFQTTKTQLLDRYHYHRAILTHDLGEFHSHLNPYWAEALCSAMNDWNVEHWLSRDERLLGLLVVQSALPEAAAKEIHRLGSNPKFVGVLMAGNPLGRPLGDPVYHPIYEAAAEHGLSIGLHPGTDRPSLSIASAGGAKPTGIESGFALMQQAMTYVASFIEHGVFERWPGLHVCVKEFGIGWVPSVVWRLDAEYRLLKLESPWVKRLPSEYVRDHIRFSTQPIEEGPKGALAQVLGSLDGIEDLLCFSSDYPHISMDDPLYVARVLPEEWHPKLFFENASGLYGIAPPVELGAAARG
jgi:uncharacterized protein